LQADVAGEAEGDGVVEGERERRVASLVDGRPSGPGAVAVAWKTAPEPAVRLSVARLWACCSRMWLGAEGSGAEVSGACANAETVQTAASAKRHRRRRKALGRLAFGINTFL
jgi:hypothetical protein